MSTQIKGSQILDGTIDVPDISSDLKKEIAKTATTINDSNPDFLFNKIIGGNGVTIAVVGASGSSQQLQLSAAGSQTAASGWSIDGAGVVFTTSSISVDGSASFAGDGLEITGSLLVSGSSVLDGDAQVTGILYGDGGFELSGNLLELSGSLIVSGGSEVHGDLTVDGTIYGGGAEISINETIISGTLFVTGAVDMSGSLKVNGCDLSAGGWRDLWHADLTTGQTIQAWSSDAQKVVLDKSGRSLSWKFHQGNGVTAGMTSSGLRLSYPSSNVSGSCGSLSFSLDDLGLSGFGGRPWRIMFRCTSSGTIQSGVDALQMSVDLDGSGASSSSCTSQHAVVLVNNFYESTGLVEAATSCIGGDVTSSDAAWGDFDVFCVEQSCGNVAVKMGNFSGDFPKENAMSPFACGSIVGQFGPYQMNPRISLKISAGGTSAQFSERSWMLTHVLVQGL